MRIFQTFYLKYTLFISRSTLAETKISFLCGIEEIEIFFVPIQSVTLKESKCFYYTFFWLKINQQSRGEFPTRENLVFPVLRRQRKLKI